MNTEIMPYKWRLPNIGRLEGKGWYEGEFNGWHFITNGWLALAGIEEIDLARDEKYKKVNLQPVLDRVAGREAVVCRPDEMTQDYVKCGGVIFNRTAIDFIYAVYPGAKLCIWQDIKLCLVYDANNGGQLVGMVMGKTIPDNKNPWAKK